MSQIVNEFSTLIDWLNSQSTYGKIGISIAISVSFLLLTKHLFLKKLGDYVTKTKGGEGVIREILDKLINIE